jgi:hypothetical protein
MFSSVRARWIECEYIHFLFAPHRIVGLPMCRQVDYRSRYACDMLGFLTGNSCPLNPPARRNAAASVIGSRPSVPLRCSLEVTIDFGAAASCPGQSPRPADQFEQRVSLLTPGRWGAALEVTTLPKDSQAAASWEEQTTAIRPATIDFCEPTAIGSITAADMTTSMAIPATTEITRTETTAATTRTTSGDRGPCPIHRPGRLRRQLLHADLERWSISRKLFARG